MTLTKVAGSVLAVPSLAACARAASPPRTPAYPADPTDQRAAIAACEQAERDYSGDQAADFDSVKATRYPSDEPAYLVTGYETVRNPYFPTVHGKWTCTGSVDATGNWVGAIFDSVNGTPPILDRP